MSKSCLKHVYEISPKKPRNFNIKLQNSTLTSIIKKKKCILREKGTKNTFPQQKNTTMKKAQKNLFFKNTCREDCNIGKLLYAVIYFTMPFSPITDLTFFQFM